MDAIAPPETAASEPPRFSAASTLERWFADAALEPQPGRIRRLLDDARGPAFACAIVDAVLRPESPRASAKALDRATRRLPESLPTSTRIGVQLLAGFGLLLPRPFMPVAKRAILDWADELVVRHGADDLSERLAALTAGGGVRLTVAPLLPDPLHDGEADAHVGAAVAAAGVADALLLPVTAVLVRPSLLAFESTVATAVERLLPVALRAADRGRTLILEAVTHADLELTAATLKALYAHPELDRAHPAISVPASLPDSAASLQRLLDWGAARSARGAAPLVVRVAKGRAQVAELLEAEKRGLPLAAFAARAETDAQFVRLVETALGRPAVRVIAATDNLVQVFGIRQRARRDGAASRLDIEFEHGTAPAQSKVAARELGGCRLLVHTVPEDDTEALAAHLLHRIRDHVDPDRDAALAHRLAGDAAFRRTEQERFERALQDAASPAPATPRRQGESWREVTDASSPASRDWALAVLESVPIAASLAPRTGSEGWERLVGEARAAGEDWAARSISERAAALEGTAASIASLRAELIAAAIADAGLRFEDADAEVAAAIDLAEHHTRLAALPALVAEARVEPGTLALVLGPRSSPIAGPLGAMMAALSAGSAVLLKPAPSGERSARVLHAALVSAGLPPSACAVLDGSEDDRVRSLVENPDIDRLLLSGSRHVAKEVRTWRPSLPVFGVTGGRNTMIVTASADQRQAVADLLTSLLDHAGQAQTSVSTLVLVGDVGASERFLRLLRGAIASIRAGEATAAPTELGPLVRPAQGPVHELLTRLAEGEHWLVQPRVLDEAGRLWSAGLRDGVEPGSRFHLAENRAPVLGLIRVDTLDEAIELLGATGFGLAAGLHSLDRDEVDRFVENAEAGSLFINRPVVIRRPSWQPQAAWGRAQLGAGAARGGRIEPLTLTRWAPAPTAEDDDSVLLTGLSAPVVSLIEAAQPMLDFDEFVAVRAGARSDEKAWVEEYGSPHPLSRLHSEQHLLRYRPVPVTVRLSEDATNGQLVRVLAAATRAGAPVVVSVPAPLPKRLVRLFGALGAPLGVAQVVVESDRRWQARVHAGEVVTPRIRQLGGDPVALALLLEPHPRITAYAAPVTGSGLLELLPFLREQHLTAASQRAGFVGLTPPAL